MEDQTQTDSEANLSSQSQDSLEGIKKLSQPVRHQVDGSKSSVPKQKNHNELHAENAQFRHAMHSQNAKQAYYTPEGVPVEDLVTEKTLAKAKSRGIMSIVFAVISLAFFPPVFGLLGIISGFKARKLGASTLGLVGIILSSVFMGIGIALSAWYFNSDQVSGNELTGGTIGFFLKLF